MLLSLKLQEAYKGTNKAMHNNITQTNVYVPLPQVLPLRMAQPRRIRISVVKPRNRSSSTPGRLQLPGRWRSSQTRSLRTQRPLRYSCLTQSWACWSFQTLPQWRLWILEMVRIWYLSYMKNVLSPKKKKTWIDLNRLEYFISEWMNSDYSSLLSLFQNRIDSVHSSSRVQDRGGYWRAVSAGTALRRCQPGTHGCLLHSARWDEPVWREKNLHKNGQVATETEIPSSNSEAFIRMITVNV